MDPIPERVAKLPLRKTYATTLISQFSRIKKIGVSSRRDQTSVNIFFHAAGSGEVVISSLPTVMRIKSRLPNVVFTVSLA